MDDLRLDPPSGITSGFKRLRDTPEQWWSAMSALAHRRPEAISDETIGGLLVQAARANA